ncbi:hypothetical protein LSAT2_001479 [Lamellibrachia satsuma]|nr:hypothetical protein LSAT2_001479 [Lamellibrachia satsuma]
MPSDRPLNRKATIITIQLRSMMQFAIVTVLAVVAVPIAIDSGGPPQFFHPHGLVGAVGGGFEQAGEFSREVEGGGESAAS